MHPRPPSVLTSREDALSDAERLAHRALLRRLQSAGLGLDLGCLYVIERVGDAAYTKAGLTSLARIGARSAELQTGDPLEHRIVNVVLFRDREAARRVEALLKRDYAARGLRAPGGTEWYLLPRHAIVDDALRHAHDLQLGEIGRRFADGGGDGAFYGAVVIEVRGGTVLPLCSPSPPPPVDPVALMLADIREAARSPHPALGAAGSLALVHIGLVLADVEGTAAVQGPQRDRLRQAVARRYLGCCRVRDRLAALAADPLPSRPGAPLAAAAVPA